MQSTDRATGTFARSAVEGLSGTILLCGGTVL
jgi:hypothetical protein